MLNTFDEFKDEVLKTSVLFVWVYNLERIKKTDSRTTPIVTWRSCTGFYATTRCQPSTAYQPRTPWPDTWYLNTSRTAASHGFPAHNTFRAPRIWTPSTVWDKTVWGVDIQNTFGYVWLTGHRWNATVIIWCLTHKTCFYQNYYHQKQGVSQWNRRKFWSLEPSLRHTLSEITSLQRSQPWRMNIVQSHITEIDEPMWLWQ